MAEKRLQSTKHFWKDFFEILKTKEFGKMFWETIVLFVVFLAHSMSQQNCTSSLFRSLWNKINLLTIHTFSLYIFLSSHDELDDWSPNGWYAVYWYAIQGVQDGLTSSKRSLFLVQIILFIIFIVEKFVYILTFEIPHNTTF